MRGTTLSVSTNLDMVVEECCNCGCVFALTTYMKEKLLKNRSSFYCPNGHPQSYTGKTEAEKLRGQLAAKERELKREQSRTRTAQAREKMAENSLRATKGHLTRAKKRASHGVCPCCNRQFKNMQRHMTNKHPDYVEKTVSDGELTA